MKTKVGWSLRWSAVRLAIFHRLRKRFSQLVSLMTRIYRVAQRVRDGFVLGIAGLVLAALCIGVFAIPVYTAANIRGVSAPIIALAAVLYLSTWVWVVVLVVDSAAYAYDFKRPFLSTWRGGIALQKGTIRKPWPFVKRSLLSYVLAIYVFAILYLLASSSNDKAFMVLGKTCKLDFLTAIYFAVVTAATVGFGDVVPCTKVARCLVMGEIAVSFGYVIFIFSTIAGLAVGRGKAS